MSIFTHALNLMDNQDPKSLEKSIDNCHHKGLFSLVIGGTENGKLTRVFIATKKIKLSGCTFHSHTYDLTIGVIKGEFMHHIAKDSDMFMMNSSPTDVMFNWVRLPTYHYQSPLNNGKGLEFDSMKEYYINSTVVPAGGEIHLRHTDIHSVTVSEGTMWVLQEHGFETDKSTVIGKPFTVDGLYTPPKQYQVNDMWQLVYNELKEFRK